MQCCLHVIDSVASRQNIFHFTTDIACLVDNGAKIMLKGLSYQWTYIAQWILEMEPLIFKV